MPKQIKTEDIVNAIVKMKVENNCSTKSLLDFLMGDLNYKQAYAYEILQKARLKINEIWKENAETHLQESKAQLESMLESATRRGDHKLALEIRKEINKMCGLYAAEKIDVSVTQYKAKFGE